MTVCLIHTSHGLQDLYPLPLTVTIELAPDTQSRLEFEAARRGITIDQVISELAAPLPTEDPLEAFIGSGSSRRTDLSRRHREIRIEETVTLTAPEI